MNYSKYFTSGQRVFLINVDKTRETTIYDSFSATVRACTDEYLDLSPAYKLSADGSCPYSTGTYFKITTESFNMGVEIFASFENSPRSDVLRFIPKGALEIYQRRQSQRVDATLPCLNVPQKSSLTAFRREWNRVVADLHSDTPPKLKLVDTQINISAGGMRMDLSGEPANLSIMVVDLNDEKPPVCVIAEMVWSREQPDSDLIRCGYRFVNILKEDQKRILDFVDREVRKQGLSGKGGKLSRELMDEMTGDIS